MPVRRGHVALQNTYLDTIIRKFDGQNRKFLIANAQMKNCSIIYCNEGFCQMFGFSRAEIMQQPCTCQFLVGPGTMKSALAQIGQALLGSEERKVEILYYAKEGTCLPCLVDVVPVKNEDGAVIMFILNFQELLDTSPKKGGLRQRMAQGWIKAGQSRRLRLKLPSLRSIALHRPSLTKDQFEGVVVDYLQRWTISPISSTSDIKGTSTPERIKTKLCDLKPSMLNSTSDSDLMKYRTVTKIPQVTLNFAHDRLRPPSPTEIEIIAPSKVKDRTQNVTEKVTQTFDLTSNDGQSICCMVTSAGLTVKDTHISY
ncbi:hypothetical protein Z043_112503 [Scleropages formosus]|uniref:PAC domain-containing protein n=1 Tax=Scleropages formosus TaxID=113540 RepID=A0A0N8JZA5_SCLFO|nr:hypothetical protein Z043_112503 [Scleropages formosus]